MKWRCSTEEEEKTPEMYPILLRTAKTE